MYCSSSRGEEYIFLNISKKSQFLWQKKLLIKTAVEKNASTSNFQSKELLKVKVYIGESSTFPLAKQFRFLLSSPLCGYGICIGRAFRLIHTRIRKHSPALLSKTASSAISEYFSECWTQWDTRFGVQGYLWNHKNDFSIAVKTPFGKKLRLLNPRRITRRKEVAKLL